MVTLNFKKCKFTVWQKEIELEFPGEESKNGKGESKTYFSLLKAIVLFLKACGN